MASLGPALSIFNFLDRYVVGYALGTAAGPALSPFVQDLENVGWQLNSVKPPTVYTLAPMVAKGLVDKPIAQTWANQQGISDPAFDALITGSHGGPDFTQLLELFWRNKIGPGEFEDGLRLLNIDPAWWPRLEVLQVTHLSPAEAANARQQQFIQPQDQRDIAALYGIDGPTADIQFELAGLPPGVETGLEMWRRKIIDGPTFDQIVAEGHTKTKYTGQLEQLKDRVLNADVYARLYLKGHITQDQMHTGGALTGYLPADMDNLELAMGRPATVHQIHVGYMRGANLPGATDEKDAITKAVAESDIRPEYTDLLYAQRATFPSMFMLNRLVQAHAIDPATAADWARKSGLDETVVTVLEKYWATLGGGAVADAHVGKAQTQLWTTVHTAYKNGEITEADATTALPHAGVSPAAIPDVLAIWDVERTVVRKQLTPAVLKKAWATAATNPATGQPWTHDEVTAELVARGYSLADATTYLEV